MGYRSASRAKDNEGIAFSVLAFQSSVYNKVNYGRIHHDAKTATTIDLHFGSACCGFGL